MKSLMVVVILGVALFAASAGLSWMFIYKPEPPVDEENAVTDVSIDGHEFLPPINEDDKKDDMAVVIRPETPVTVEAVTELAQSIMKKERVLYEAEQRLKQEEKRVRMLFEDVKRERDELSSFGQQIDGKISQAREAVKLLQLERQGLAQETKTLSDLQRKSGKTVVDLEEEKLDRRVKTVKDWFTNLDEEQAADYLKEIANRGDVRFAAKLLDSLEPRKVAKVLGAFNDAPLVAEIVDSYTKGGPPNQGSTKSRFIR